MVVRSQRFSRYSSSSFSRRATHVLVQLDSTKIAVVRRFSCSSLCFSLVTMQNAKASFRWHGMIRILVVVGVVLALCDAFRFVGRLGSGAFTIHRPMVQPVNHRQTAKYCLPEGQLITDEMMEEWLDDMIYSGDIEGYIRRQAKEVVSADFKEYLDERLAACHDEDEKRVLSEIAQILAVKLAVTEGLVDSDELFASRLDKILFTAPNLRKTYIQNNVEDMTPTFIDFIQKELKSTKDSDNKVVYASLLMLIGQTKGSDLLGADAALLSEADGSLGDQFKKVESDLLADGTDLNEAKKTKVSDRNEQILAGLFFSQNDILEDVLNNLHEINEDFVTYLQGKIDSSKDMDERVGLSSLLQTITTVLDRVKEAQGDGTTGTEEELTIDQVRQRMQEVQMGGEVSTQGKIAEKFGVFSVKEDKKDTFQGILRRFTEMPEGYSLEQAVEENYDLCDYEFMGMLNSEIAACLAEGADIEAQQYDEIQAVIRSIMVKRIGGAQDRLQRILSKRHPKAMESEVVSMVRKGEVDEALCLLIEANTQQAQDAGATQAADVLRKLTQRINMEQDRKLPDEQRLLRALMRMDDKSGEKRKGLLYDAFKPSKSMDQEGQMQEGPPMISPPAFINAVRSFITNFGNVDSFDLMGRAQLIIDDAQAVATELYGAGMSPREQQKMMFDKKTVSVWDLANYEDLAVMSGEEVPWRNDKWDNMNPEDVVGERVRRIGGGDGAGPPV